MKKQMIAFIGSGALAISLMTFGIGFANAEESPRINGSIPITNQTEAEYPAMAKVTLNRAMENAIESNQGKVLKAGLKEEDGFLVYRVEVVTPDQTIMDVMLDAGSGKVLLTRQDKVDHHDERDDREHHKHEEHEDDE
ncbi:PepSY domain-containing protein [Pseudodesulfovibrio sp.]|uniref:PepSY domain-containing protein n=1 Tax=unclassified Pseudodesulfovibrio TaxID=2661612 RepID=UPI003B006337